jgi:aryl-alcohol dehydrogenase-like predicted oxidoreductase
MWGGADERASIRSIHAFLDAGGNLIDTAPVYGFGTSEEVVGKAIAGRRDQVVIASKCSMRWDLNDAQKKRSQKNFSSNKEVVDMTGEKTAQSFDVYVYSGRDGIREEVERSLKRLGTDAIDLYQTHWQLDSTTTEERMDALVELQQAGKIRAIGVCNASPEQIAEYCKHGSLDSDQEIYSMLDREVQARNRSVCADNNLAFLAYCPLAQGLLTGKITADRKYPKGDMRHYKDRYQPENVNKVLAMLEPMHPIAARHRASLAQITLAWTLAQRGCTHVLCGARTAEQAVDNAGAGSLTLSEDELAEITRAVESYDGV